RASSGRSSSRCWRSTRHRKWRWRHSCSCSTRARRKGRGAGRRDIFPRSTRLRGRRELPVVKKRLDVVLVERGLAESRSQAQALVLAGLVRGYDKPGHQVDDAADLTVERPAPYVSRGGGKLANALDGFGIDPAGLDCLDVGASTG